MSVTLAFFYFLSFNLFVFDTLDFTVIIACAVQSVLKCSFPKIHNKTILHLLWNIRLVNVKSMYLTLESLEWKHSAFATFGSIYCSRHLWPQSSSLQSKVLIVSFRRFTSLWFNMSTLQTPCCLHRLYVMRPVPGQMEGWRAFLFVSCQKGSGF